MRFIRAVGPFVLAGFLTASRGLGQQDPKVTLMSSSPPPGTLDQSLRNETRVAIDRGLDWLAALQKEDGSWSNADFPALTALALQAFERSQHPRRNDVIDKATRFILACVQPDGSIYRQVAERQGGGLSNYNTAICMTALHALNRPECLQVVQNARQFVAASQHFGDDVYTGGFGYDRQTKRPYTDLLNTYYAVKAMRETQAVEDSRPATGKRVDIDWSATVKYIERMQNKEGAGVENAGGFFYKPDESKAGTVTNAAGAVVLRSYGSITYVGLLALVYANISRDDVRVRSAFDWASRHWNLEENPGMGPQGLYFFYEVLTKALDAYGQDLVPLQSGQLLNWRAEVARKLVSLQRIDPETGYGFWKNEVGRYWENDPVLTTAYSLLALQRL